MPNLINFYDEMTLLVDEGKAVGIVCLDFSKAFLTLSPIRQTFIEKLLKYGLDDQALRCMENGLNSQAYRVVIREV